MTADQRGGLRLTIAMVVLQFAVVAAISYLFAVAGEPQAHWLWHKLGVVQ